MVDELPTGGKAMYAFLEMIALALVFAAVENVIAHKPWPIWTACLVLAVLFFMAGIKWQEIKAVMGTRIALLVSLLLFAMVISAGAKWPQTRIRLGALLGIYAAIYSAGYVRALRRDIDRYVIPRSLSKKQIEDMRKFLSGKDVHPLTVKANQIDREAFAYASQLFGVFRNAGWDLKINSSSEIPHIPIEGLSIVVIGSNAGPPEPKRNPQKLLQETLRSARIEVNSSGAVAAGTYALYLMVGSRPVRLSLPLPPFRRFRFWIGRMLSR